MSSFSMYYDFDQLENDAERLVIEELESQLAELPDACKTEDCVLDMAALALNRVKPMYRVTLLGKLYADAVSAEHRAEVRAAVKDAIEKVMANPPESL